MKKTVEEVRATMRATVESGQPATLYEVIDGVSEGEVDFLLGLIQQCVEHERPKLSAEQQQAIPELFWCPAWKDDQQGPGFLGHTGVLVPANNELKELAGAFLRGVCAAGLLFYRQRRERLL